MTLPSYAPGVQMGADMILGELTETGQFSINANNERTLADRPSGQISFYDFYGKSDIRPGCVDITTSQSVRIPKFRQQLIVQVWGAGGGGGPAFDYAPTNGRGTDGGASVFYGPVTMTAFGGTAGQNQSTNWGTMLGGYAGTGGGASGGDGNFRGQNGQVNHGGQAPNGGAGGRGGEQTGIYVSRHGPQNATGIYKGEDGATPGGGGGGEASIGSPTPGTNNAGGGAGGYCYRTFLPGQITQGAFYNVTVGAKGHGDMYWGGNGGDGLVRLCWDVPVALPQEYMYWDGNPVMQAWGNGGGSGWGGSNPRDGVDNGGWPFLAWIFQYEPAAADPGTSSGYSCFLAGSPVIMSDGSIKMIEDIQIGEWVKGAYGESNQVLALDRPLLGNRNIYVINNEHRTTDEHPHLKPDNTFYLINKAGWLANENSSWQPVITDTGMTELWNMPGTDDTDILQPFEIGGKVITSTGERTIENITVQQHPTDTQLYNLVLGGSHTYFVEGYCVTGFINNKDFDYKSWTAKGTPWTADDYRKAKD